MSVCLIYHMNRRRKLEIAEEEEGEDEDELKHGTREETDPPFGLNKTERVIRTSH